MPLHETGNLPWPLQQTNTEVIGSLLYKARDYSQLAQVENSKGVDKRARRIRWNFFKQFFQFYEEFCISWHVIAAYPIFGMQR